MVDAEACWENAKATYDEGSDALLDGENSYHIQSQQAYEQYNKSIEEAYTTSFNTRKILTTKLQEEADEYEKVSDKIKEYNKLNNEIIANEKSVATSYAAGNPELKDKKERLKELSEELENNDLAVKNWLRGWQLKSPKAKEEVDKMVDAIDTSMSNSVNKFLTYGIDSAEGFRKGCDKKMGEVKAKAAELAQGSLDAVATTMDSHSPSRKMETLGVNAVEGFIIGVENNKQAVLDAFTNLFNALLGKVETFSKNVADSVNSTLRNLASSMDSVRINGSGKVRYTAMAYSQIPRLAQGAVIPPNQQFLAMLGDQKSGTNVEAPLSTIEQAVQNVWQKNGGGQEITLRLVSDRGFVRNLKIELDKESQRRGVKLVRGGAY